MYTDRPYPCSAEMVRAVETLIQEAEIELTEALELGQVHDDGDMLELYGAKLASIGFHDPSFNKARLGPKLAGVKVQCLKILALCPMKG